jgi:hypothetical protein
MKKWKAVEYDVTKILTGMSPKHITIPAGLNLQLEVELEDAAFGRLSRNPTWLQKMQEKANSKVNPVLETIKKKVVEIDGKAGKFDPKTAELFSKDISVFIKQRLDVGGQDMAKEVEKLFEDFKKGKSDILSFKLKCTGKIGFNAVKITAVAAATGASHGALAPLAIVGIVKSALAIAQECAKLALSADQFAKLIQGEFTVLKKVMVDDLAKAKTLRKIDQAAKEVGLNMLSAALGVETPALKNCKDHIATHKVKISGLEVKSKGLSKSVYEAMDAEEKWRKKFEAGKASLPADRVGKIVQQREKAESALKNMIDATIKVNEAIKAAQDRQELFEKTVDAMWKGIPAWVNYVQKATTVALIVGTSVGDASHILEGAVTVIHTVESGIASVAAKAS